MSKLSMYSRYPDELADEIEIIFQPYTEERDIYLHNKAMKLIAQIAGKVKEDGSRVLDTTKLSKEVAGVILHLGISDGQ